MDKNIKTAIKVLALVGFGYRIGSRRNSRTIKVGVITNVVIPGVKDIVTNVIKYEIDTVIFGYKPSKMSEDKSFKHIKYEYPKHPTYSPEEFHEKYEPKFNIRYQQKALIINTSEDAANILNTLMDSAKKYGTVAVADYYDMCGIAPEFTDNNFGWTSKMLERAYWAPYKDNYQIILPDPERLTELGGK